MNYNFNFEGNVLYITFTEPLLENTLKETLESINKTFPNKKYDIVAYQNILGYWSAKDLISNQSIYCGTMSLKSTKESIKKYLDGN